MDNSLGQLPSPLAPMKWLCVFLGKNSQEMTGSIVARHVGIAADEDFLIVAARRLAENHRTRARSRVVQVKSEQLVFHIPQLVQILPREITQHFIRLER